MYNHFSFSFLAEQTDPLSGRGDMTVCCQSAIDKEERTKKIKKIFVNYKNAMCASFNSFH